jgi:hypothetical protein
MHDPTGDDLLARRRFLRLTALTGVGLGLTVNDAAAQSGAPANSGLPSVSPTRPAETAPKPITDNAREIVGVLRRRFAAHALDDAQWERIMRDVDSDLTSGQRLRAVKLANADPPDTIFRA